MNFFFLSSSFLVQIGNRIPVIRLWGLSEFYKITCYSLLPVVVFSRK